MLNMIFTVNQVLIKQQIEGRFPKLPFVISTKVTQLKTKTSTSINLRSKPYYIEFRLLYLKIIDINQHNTYTT